MDIKKDILWRLYLCFLGMILLGAVVLGRAFYIQRIEGKYWKEMGQDLHLKYLPINDSNGSSKSVDANIIDILEATHKVALFF